MSLTGPARDAARNALRLAREASDPRKEARSLYLLARVARRQGALAEAKEFAERSLDLGELRRAHVPGYELRALFFEELESRYAFYVDLLMEMEAAKPEAAFERLAFEASERGRARVLLDRLREAPPTAPADGKSQESERRLRERISAEALREDLGTREGPDSGEKRLDEMLAELRRVQGLDQPDSSRAEPGRSNPPRIEEIQAKLADQGTLLIEYCLGAEHSYLWTLGRDRFTVHLLPPREELENQSREIYGLLTARQNETGGSTRERRARIEAQDARFREAGARLARTLLGPIADLGAFERLVIVSDGMLNYVPFSALPDPRAAASGADYVPLVLAHEIVRVPSLSAMAAMRERSGKRREPGRNHEVRVAVLADPVFTTDDPRVRGPGSAASASGKTDPLPLDPSLRGVRGSLATLPRLLASRQEATSIGRAAPGTHVTIATDFGVSRAMAEGVLRDSYEVVHFATHGVLNDEHPALSGIITSLVDEGGRQQDGFLRAQDIYGLAVTTQLVVLSACETALGKLLHGEGITGLVHAFLHAGADTVVASKWRVDDVATQELMAEFYRRLLADGVSASAALRAAQIELLRRPRTRAPFYWGAFEVYGLALSFSAGTTGGSAFPPPPTGGS